MKIRCNETLAPELWRIGVDQFDLPAQLNLFDRNSILWSLTEWYTVVWTMMLRAIIQHSFLVTQCERMTNWGYLCPTHPSWWSTGRWGSGSARPDGNPWFLELDILLVFKTASTDLWLTNLSWITLTVPGGREHIFPEKIVFPLWVLLLFCSVLLCCTLLLYHKKSTLKIDENYTLVDW